MNPKRRPVYGVLNLSREMTRRAPAHWRVVETPPRLLRSLAEVIPLRNPDHPPTPRPGAAKPLWSAAA